MTQSAFREHAIVGIGDLFLQKNAMIVPKRQRVYAWQEEHIKDLFTDLAGAIDGDSSEYFLGTIVATEDQETKKPSIVDGQQRLATTTVLLAAIRDYLLTHHDISRAGLVETYLNTTDLRTGLPLPHLQLTAIDSTFFEHRILDKPGAPTRHIAPATKSDLPSHRNIIRASELAAEHVANILAPFNGAAKITHLIKWIEFVQKRALVVWLLLESEGKAYRVFETLNDRGLNLSKSDLLKNRLLELAGNQIDLVEQRWGAMIGALASVTRKRDLSVDYVRHHRIAMGGFVREKDLYDVIKTETTSPQVAVSLADQLATNSAAYAALLNSDHEYWNDFGVETRQHIRTLRLLNVQRIRPLLLAAIIAFDKDDAQKTIAFLTSWSVRFVIAGEPAGTVETHVSNLAHRITKKEITSSRRVAKEMAPITPTDDTFISQFSVAQINDPSLARYLLRALNDAWDADGEQQTTVIDERENKINLEHVLPKARVKHGAPEWNHIPAEQAASYCDRLGNMALIRKKDNDKLKAKSFEKKRSIYAKTSGIPLTGAIAAYEKWGPDEITSRQAEFAKIAARVWACITS